MRFVAMFTAAILIAPTTPLPAGATGARHVSTSGTVWINAAALPSGSSLYSGDTLATADNGFAVINCAEQGRVEVRQDSLISVGSQEIALKGGVVGSAGTPVRLGASVIRPADGPRSHPASQDQEASGSWFVVADRDGRRLVASYEGDVVIAREGQDPVVVREGFFAVPADQPADSDDSSAGQDPKSPDPGVPDDWTVHSLTSGASVALIITLGATAVVSTIVGYTLAERSLSPSN